MFSRNVRRFSILVAVALAAGTIFISGWFAGLLTSVPGFDSAPGFYLEASGYVPNLGSTRLPVQGPFVIERDGYTVCYDGRTRNPIWVYECLTREQITGPARRRDNFSEDPLLPEHVRSTLEDFRGSGYDRGHLAAAGNHKDTQVNMDETFFLSNMSPQVGIGFNRGQWKHLEQHVRELIWSSDRVHILSGPLYLPKDTDSGRVVSYPVIGPNNVAVPTHFFKVIVVEYGEGLQERYAYVLENRVHEADNDFTSHQVPLDEAMRLTGLSLPRPN